MSSLKELDIEAGSDYERLNHNPRYLSELTLGAAMDVNNYLIGNKDGFKHVRELAGILRKYQLRDDDTFISSKDFPYVPLWRAMNGDNLSRSHISELALKMRLLRAELDDITHSNQLDRLVPFLCDLSKEFQQATIFPMP